MKKMVEKTLDLLRAFDKWMGELLEFFFPTKKEVVKFQYFKTVYKDPREMRLMWLINKKFGPHTPFTVEDYAEMTLSDMERVYNIPVSHMRSGRYPKVKREKTNYSIVLVSKRR